MSALLDIVSVSALIAVVGCAYEPSPTPTELWGEDPVEQPDDRPDYRTHYSPLDCSAAGALAPEAIPYHYGTSDSGFGLNAAAAVSRPMTPTWYPALQVAREARERVRPRPSWSSGRERDDLGFGMARIPIWGNYAGDGGVDCWQTAVTFNGALERNEIKCSWYGKASQELHDAMVKELGPAFRIRQTRRETRAEATSIYPRVACNAQRHRADALGPILRAEITTTEMAAAYELLMSPTANIDIGYSCSNSATPEGARAIGRIARRRDLLRNVLRGPNPEARFYAAGVLLTWRYVVDEDWKAIDALEALPIDLDTCSGCIGEHWPSSELFANFALPTDEPYYKWLIWRRYGWLNSMPTLTSPLARMSPVSVKSSTCTTRGGRERCPSVSDTFTTTRSPWSSAR